MTSRFSGPVQFARILHEHGLALAEAHAAVSRLSNERSVKVYLASEHLDDAIARMRALGLTADALHESFPEKTWR